MERKVKQIPQYREGEVVNDLFVVRFKKPIRKTRGGKYFFELKLQDALGDTMLKFWGTESKESIQFLYDSIKPDSVIKVINGRINYYKEKIEISVSEDVGTVRVLKQEDYNIKDFIRISHRDPDEMMGELIEIINTIKNGELKAVIDAFLKDEEFVKRFKTAPAAMYKHHGWVSGLLEHTLTITKICDDITKHHPKLDRDLLLTGALFHDIGKIEEFEVTTLIKVTDKGNLLGHITMGIQMLTRRLDKLNVSDMIKQKLLHMMISHHGSAANGSPKNPSFPEALLLSKVDELDAFVTQMTEHKETATTEDSFIYSKDFGNIFLK
jgi:3'-5' exoribonuclease